ncbi:MAG: 23S rRNA pseudouridine(1911/1915/1917) synthase RluD [Pseudomonadota bacterium]|nr:MAG: 23S rRNA pseudouridine(1911/1915/1917) synthase RluD [Pseudomonadota bacterium]
MDQPERLTAVVPPELAGLRLDQALAEMFPDYSRARLQRWIRDGQVQVDARGLRARDKVHGGETVQIDVVATPEDRWEPESIPLDLVYEDEHILVIAKPAGLVVHPAVGNRAGTLLNALLHYAPELAAVPRAGIVHRLDKDTSGLLVVARTLVAQNRLVEQLQARAFLREYQAIVNGVLPAGGTVDAPIGRHPVHRKRMAVTERGKPAKTHYRVVERYRVHSLLKVSLETGRTHQIRVHMAHIRCPILGDPVYGGRMRIPPQCGEALRACLQGFRRQALHAIRLGLEHPVSGEPMEWSQPLPDDMAELVVLLRADARQEYK